MGVCVYVCLSIFVDLWILLLSVWITVTLDVCMDGCLEAFCPYVWISNSLSVCPTVWMCGFYVCLSGFLVASVCMDVCLMVVLISVHL